MKSWAQIQMYIDHHQMPYKVQRFNMTLAGVLVDTFTDEVVASTVKQADQWLRCVAPTLQMEVK